MTAKLLKNRGFSLSEVMVSSAILVLVTAGFATVGIMMRSLSNVKARNVAYSISNNTISSYQRNPSAIPTQDIVIGNPPPTIQEQENRPIGTRDGGNINQTFNLETTFVPVHRVAVVRGGVTEFDLVDYVDPNGDVEQLSRLIKIRVSVTWQDYRQQRTYRIEEEDYIRKAE